MPINEPGKPEIESVFGNRIALGKRPIPKRLRTNNLSGVLASLSVTITSFLNIREVFAQSADLQSLVECLKDTSMWITIIRQRKFAASFAGIATRGWGILRTALICCVQLPSI